MRASVLFILLCGVGCDDAMSARDAAAGADAAAGTDAGAADAAIADAGARDAATADAGIDAGPPPCGDWTGPTPIRALVVGNSQIQYQDFAGLLTGLAASAPPECPRIEATMFARGGANLGDLWRDGADGRQLSEALGDGYHVVVLAESIDLVELPGFVDRFRADATVIIDAARAEGVVPVLYATPYVEVSDAELRFHQMADPQIALGTELSVIVAAGGLAWLRVWAARADADLYHTDRAHPGQRGSYVSALVVYAAITGASPVGLTDDPGNACFDGPCPPIEADLLPIFQTAALEQHLDTGR